MLTIQFPLRDTHTYATLLNYQNVASYRIARNTFSFFLSFLLQRKNGKDRRVRVITHSEPKREEMHRARARIHTRLHLHDRVKSSSQEKMKNRRIVRISRRERERKEKKEKKRKEKKKKKRKTKTAYYLDFLGPRASSREHRQRDVLLSLLLLYIILKTMSMLNFSKVRYT